MGVRAVGALLLALGAAAAAAQTGARMNEQVVMVSVGSGFTGAELETTIFRPDGPGPFPVALINHGKAPGNPYFQERARYIYASREFVRRGYAVVLPMRLGFSKSSGTYMNPGCNIASNGEMQAGWVEGVIAWLGTQPFADASRIVVLGQSHGGLTTMALGSRAPKGVLGLVNFAGGLRIESCLWQGALAEAFERYASASAPPSLWFYGDNDSYFAPELFKELHARYVARGGKARLVGFGRFSADAHGMFASARGLSIWVPEMERFLESLGLPYKPTVQVSDVPRLAASGFASLHDVTALPYVRDSGRNGYAEFLKKGTPRAFAIAPSGAWGWAAEGDDPTARALDNCRKHSKTPCRLYAIDEDVVWAAD